MRLLIIGGDRRFEFAAEKLREYGFTVDRVPLGEEWERIGGSFETSGTKYDGLILPPRVNIENADVPIINYLADEELLVLNAVLTAEAAVEILIRETETSLFGSKILIIGYGRIAKILSRYLRDLRASVTICARKELDLTVAETNGLRTIALKDLIRDADLFGGFDSVVNTVPASLFGEEHAAVLSAAPSYVLDLASSSAFGAIPARFNRALSLPGKVSPIKAGYIIADAVKRIIAN